MCGGGGVVNLLGLNKNKKFTVKAAARAPLAGTITTDKEDIIKTIYERIWAFQLYAVSTIGRFNYKSFQL